MSAPFPSLEAIENRCFLAEGVRIVLIGALSCPACLSDRR
jgi:hypothetical protein